MSFLFEKLVVYKKALELHQNLHRYGVTNTLEPALRRQLFRAASSIVLNIGEANGRVSRKEQRYHYAVARGSLFECLAAWALYRDSAYDIQRFDILESAMRELGSLLNGVIGQLNVNLLSRGRKSLNGMM